PKKSPVSSLPSLVLSVILCPFYRHNFNRAPKFWRFATETSLRLSLSLASRYDDANDIAVEKTRSAAPTTASVATDAAIQALWAEYVQNLVSEQIAAIHDGVIAGGGEAINEQLDRLFEETNKIVRRELEVNSAKVEAALADVRGAKAEIREEIRAELLAEIRAEIADRTALIKQPVDGAPGPAGPPGKLEIVTDHVKGRVY